MNNNNLLLEFSLAKQAVDGSQSSFGHVIEYGLGSSTGLRLYKGLFFQFGSILNFGLGGVNIATSNRSLQYQFKINKKHRPVYITPMVGQTIIEIKQKGLGINQQFRSWVFGVNTSIEISRKKRFFVSQIYYHNYWQSGTATSIVPTNYAVSLGFIFIR